MKKNKKKVKLDLEILELESKIAPNSLPYGCFCGALDTVQTGAEC